MIRISKNIIRSVIFLTGLILLLIFFSHVFIPDKEMYNATAVEEKEKYLKEEKSDTIDVILAGDSECYSAFSPLQIWVEQGITSFLCGTSAQRLCDTYVLLQSTFETQSPEVVILETNCLYRFAGMNKETDDQVLAGLSKYLPVFQYHSRWKSFVTIMDKENIDVRMKGFRKRTGVHPYKGGAYMIESSEVKEIPALAEEYLEKIQKLCEEHQAELILVSAPSAKNWNYAKHNGVQKWADANATTYIDLNLQDELGIDWSKDTKDGGDHLNYAGAKKVTAFLGSWLKENRNLTDHREEESYEHWYEDCGLLE